VNRYEHVILDRERPWYELVYNNTYIDVFYCPDLIKKFYTRVDMTTINLEHNQFLVHLDHDDLLVTSKAIEEATQVPVPPKHAAPLLLIDYMPLMSARCT